MRTTIIIDDALIEEVRKITNIQEKTTLVHMGLRSLLAEFARKRLAKLGGSETNVKPVPRRKA